MADQPVWTKIFCPLCGGKQKYRLMRFAPGTSTVPIPEDVGAGAGAGAAARGLDLVRCHTCSLVYLDFVPTAASMEKMYASDCYFGQDADTGYADYDKQQQSLGRTFQRFLEKICHHRHVCGAIADIGCGNGLLLEQARPWFSLRVGSDMSVAAVDRASLVCDRAIVGGPQQILDAGLFGFDLVTAISVLEHIYDPVQFLQDCGRLLGADGCVAMTMPHFDGFWRRAMGRFWTSFKIPEHLSYWDKHSLAELGRRTGFQVKQFMPYHHYFPLSVVLDKLGMGRVHAMGAFMETVQIFLPCVMLTVVYEKGNGR